MIRQGFIDYRNRPLTVYASVSLGLVPRCKKHEHDLDYSSGFFNIGSCSPDMSETLCLPLEAPFIIKKR